jgi:hypothetical protein
MSCGHLKCPQETNLKLDILMKNKKYTIILNETPHITPSTKARAKYLFFVEMSQIKSIQQKLNIFNKS